MELNDISEKVIGCAIKVHKNLGAGFLESVYQAALEYEFTKNSLKFEREKGLPVKYKDIYLEVGFRCDFLVEESIIVECKAIKEISSIEIAQVLNYLKISNFHLGLLINFNTTQLIKGIKRIVND